MALDGGDEPALRPREHHVRGLLSLAHQALQMRQGDSTEQYHRCLGHLHRPKYLAGTVSAVRHLLCEVPVDQHREQAVRGGVRDTEAFGRIGHPHRALLLEQGGEVQGMVHGSDRVGRFVLHSRSNYSSRHKNGQSAVWASARCVAVRAGAGTSFWPCLLTPSWPSSSQPGPSRG